VIRGGTLHIRGGIDAEPSSRTETVPTRGQASRGQGRDEAAVSPGTLETDARFFSIFPLWVPCSPAIPMMYPLAEFRQICR